MRAGRVWLVFVIIALASSGILCQENADQNYFEIEPGWRVGPLLMGMSPEQVQEVYGETKVFAVPDPHGGKPLKLIQYNNQGLELLFRHDQLEEIHVSYPIYSVKGIVKVGSSVERIKEVLGNAYIVENYQHSYKSELPEYKMIYNGIVLDIKSDRAVKIVVKRKK